MVSVTTTVVQLVIVFAVGCFLSPYVKVNSKKHTTSKYCYMVGLVNVTCFNDTPLHTIPRPPPEAYWVSLEDMQLGYITKVMTRNLTFCNLNGLNLKNNNITGISEDAFEDLLYLENLYWTQSVLPVRDFKNLFLKQGSNLTTLELTGSINYSLDPSMFLGLTNLVTLVLFSMDLVTFNVSMLSSIQTLTDLDLSFNELVDIEAGWRLPNLTYLGLYDNRLTRVPQMCTENTTSHLRTLDLSGNDIQFLDHSLSCFKELNFLDLSGNNIQVITEDSFPFEFRSNLKTIDLTNNSLRCTCDLLWFTIWMDDVIKNKSIDFLNFMEYKCYKDIPVARLSSYRPTAALCRVKDTYVIFLTIILSVALVLIVAGLVIYRYRWYILYWISLLRRRKQHDQLRLDWRYDGFVSYSNPDLDWMLEELLAFLEDEVGLKLCEHGRDFQPGKYIVDNVIDAVDNSRKTILVISNEYMKSAWCQFELNMVLSSYLNNEIDIVVILLENIDVRHMTSSLRALMMSTTYLEWSDEEEARRLFREKLKNAMTDGLV